MGKGNNIMDNRYETQNSAAVDFSLFDTSHRQTVKKPEEDKNYVPLRLLQKPVQTQTQTAQKPRGVRRLLRPIAFSVLLLGMLVFYLSGNTQLMAARKEAMDLEAKLNSVRQSSIDLESELQRRVAACDLDQYATTKLGMVKLQRSQIVYFDFNDEDQVVYVAR